MSLGGGLDPGLATELAGLPPRPELAPPAERVAWALAAVPLRPDPADAVLARAAARGGRRTRWVAGAVTVLLVVTAVATWVGTRSPDEDTLPEEVVVSPADNVAPVAWWADGVLHLPDVELETPRVRAMVEVPDGVVYVDTQDRVVLADRAGRLTPLGDTEPDAPLVGWTERGWVGWVDVAGEERELVVHDTRTGRDVDRRPAEDGARVIAVDQARLYYDVGGQPWSWPVPGAEPGRAPGRTLVDVASAVRVSAHTDELLRVDQPLFDIQVTLPGREAQLSPDGDYLMTRIDGDVPDELRVFRAADGRQEGPHLSDLELAVAAAFGDDHTVTYLITRRDLAPDNDAFIRLSETGELQMRTCDLDLQACTNVATLPSSRGVPVFAQ